MLFKEIIGQQKVKEKLIQTVKEGRISHAQLFLGSEGSGNLALAVAYAQYITCENQQAKDACGKCSSCVKNIKLIHPDIHFAYPVATTKEVKEKPISSHFLPQWRESILQNPYLNLFQWLQYIGIETKQGNISVQESSEIIKKISLKPYESEYKIMIIWMPEKMNIAAANKLLKIIEEPPPKTLFILVAENQDHIINTILSRTQIIKINKIEDNDLQIALEERYGLSQKESESITFFANGNLLEAQRFMNENKEKNFNHDYFKGWMRLCYAKDFIKITEWVEEIAAIGRERQKHFLAYGLHIFRESFMIQIDNINLIRLNGEELVFAKSFSPFINGKNITQLMELFNEAYYHIERNAYSKSLFLDLSFKIMSLLKK